MFFWMFWDHTMRRGSSFAFRSLAPFLIVGIFAYGFALALVNSVDMPIAIQFAIAPLILMLVHFIVLWRIDFDRIAVIGSHLLLICTALFWISLTVPELPLSSSIYQFFMDFNFSGVADREFFDGGVTFTMQLGTAPWLFVGFCIVGMRFFSAERKRWDGVMLGLIGLGILISGLRGLISITFIYTVFLFIRATSPRYRWLTVIGITALSWAIWSEFINGSQIFSAGEGSNMSKLGHFNSYLSHLSVWNGVSGEGLGSYYFSTGSGSLRSNTELTPIDMARYFGIPLTLLLYLSLFFPLPGLWRYTRNQGGYLLAMLLYTALSMTNPVMFNSYGLLVVLWYWCSLMPLQYSKNTKIHNFQNK